MEIQFSKEKVVGNVVIEKPITEYDVETVIVTCFEGGSNYWLGLDNDTPEWKDKPIDVPSSIWATKLLLEGKTIHFYDIEDENEQWQLTLENLTNGFNLNAKKRPDDCDLEQGDATTSDCILQYGLFGKLVYG